MIDLWHSALSWWKSTFLSSFVAVFWRFLPLNAPIMLDDICYWWFFLSQSNWWTKYFAHPKIWRPKSCLLIFASLVTLDNFYLLLSTQQTADLTPEWSGGPMFQPLSHIYAKNPFCCLEIVANNVLNHQRIIVFGQLWANVTPILNTAFSLTNGEYANFWYLQLHCYLMHFEMCHVKVSSL